VCPLGRVLVLPPSVPSLVVLRRGAPQPTVTYTASRSRLYSSGVRGWVSGFTTRTGVTSITLGNHWDW
jgi:hypothetical protein